MGGYFSSIIRVGIVWQTRRNTYFSASPTINRLKYNGAYGSFNSETIDQSTSKLWHHYYPNTDGGRRDSRLGRYEAVSAGTTRVARTDVQSPPYPPFLIFANKQDIAGSSMLWEESGRECRCVWRGYRRRV